MINIYQRPSKKCAGKYSLWISFDFNQKIVDIIKLAENVVYYKDTKEWEVPLSKLSYLIDSLTYIDDIDLNLLPDNNEYELKQTIIHKYKPFEHQDEGIEWMMNRDSGLLLDVPGLGKTLQTIYSAEELKKQKDIKHCLIICGINTLKQNWKKEIEKFSTESCRVIGERVNSKGNIYYASVQDRAEELYNTINEFFVVINIESLRDSLVLDAILDSKNSFDMIVCDECHKCKNPQSAQGKALLKLTKVGKYHFGLTGTMLVNSPLDAYVPLRFIGHEKASFTNFKNFYCNISQKFGHYQIDGFKNLDVLKDEIGDCSLRRTKEILDLPPKIIIPEYVELESNHMKFYSDIQAGVISEADRVNIKTTSLLGLVTRLRQAVTCPEVLTSKDLSSTKLERAIELVEEIVSNGEKVIIFSTFKEPLYRLYGELKEYKPLICTGDQSEIEISEAIDKFQEDDIHKVILCTISKMGTGLTLHRASYEIFIDSAWTYALQLQAEDRAHRVNSKNTLTIYNLIGKGTIDERIQNILERKRAISDYIIDDKITNEVEELKELLGL